MLRTVSAQETAIPQNFFYPKEALNFNLPQFDFTLPLPKGAGFCLPLAAGEGVAYEQTNDVFYYFSPRYLSQDSFAFKFSLSPSDEKDCLWMYVIAANKERVKQEVEYNIKKSAKGTYSALSSFMTMSSPSINYKQTLPDENSHYIYIISLGNYSFLFRLNGEIDSQKKKQYEKIIRQAEENNLGYRRVRYETKVEAGDYAFKGTDVQQELKLSKNQGFLLNEFTFDWDSLGFSARIPERFEYQVSGKIKYRTVNYVKVYTGDRAETIIGSSSSFTHEELMVTFRTYGEHTAWVDESLHSEIQISRYSKDLEIVVDGVSFPAKYYGSKSSGTLSFVFATKGFEHLVSFSGINNRNLPLVEKIISGLKLDIPKPTFAKLNIVRLPQALGLDNPESMQLDKPLQLTSSFSQSFFECNLTDLGIRIYLKENPEDYKYYIGNEKEGSINNGIIRGNPSDAANNRLSIYKKTGVSDIYYQISKSVRQVSVEDYTYILKQALSNYSSIEVVYAGVNRINEIDWSILFYKTGQHYTGMFTAWKGNYEVQLIVNHDGKEQDALKKAAYIKTVWFKILPDFE